MSAATRECWLQSFSNLKVTILDLKPDQVQLADIAHALAQKPRFAGQTRFLADGRTEQVYTVGQHCIEGVRLLPWAFKLPFLLHEVSEVYLPDVASPLKPYVVVDVPERGQVHWADLEAHHAAVILAALGLSAIEPLLYAPQVKAMDLALLAAERDQLLGAPPEDWGLTVDPAPVNLAPMRPEYVEREWLRMYAELTAA